MKEISPVNAQLYCSGLIAAVTVVTIKLCIDMFYLFYKYITAATLYNYNNSLLVLVDKLELKLDVCLSVHRCICVEKKNQLDVTVCFIAFMIRSTRFGHFYAHHQDL